MSDAFWAYGSELQVDDGTGTFTGVAEITKLSGPNMKRDTIEVTHMLSPGGYREFISGWRDGGEMAYEANWLPFDPTQDESTGIRAAFNNNTAQDWRVVVPDIVEIAFSGFITAHEIDLPLEEQGKVTGTIKINGLVTFTDIGPGMPSHSVSPSSSNSKSPSSSVSPSPSPS